MNVYNTLVAAALLFLPVHLSGQSSIRAEGSAATRAEASRGAGAEQSGAGSAALAATAAAGLAATAAAGLPTSHVSTTIREGEAKGASRSQMDRAAMQAHGRLVVASEIFSEGPQRGRGFAAAELTAAAEAFAAGASRADVRRVREATPSDRNAVVSLQTLTHLRALGVAGNEASRTIAARLESGASDSQISGLLSGAAGGRAASGAGSGAGAVNAVGRIGGGASGVSGALGGGASVTGSLGGSIF